MKKPPQKQSDETPWYADGRRFTCTQCGNCCGGAPGYVWVSKAEIKAIATRLDMTDEDFVAKHTRKVGWRRSLLEQDNWDCEFLVPDASGKKVCSIYEVRPVQCRTWPFWKSNLATEQEWQLAARECPGMNHGTHHPLPVIQERLAANGSLPL